MRLGIIGTGTIASAVVRGIAGDGHQITVSERSAHHAQRLADMFDTVTVADNQTVVDQSEVILIGLMADTAPEVLSELTFRPDQKVISLMAGASLAEVATMVAPAQAAAIMIPFPGIAVGGSPVLVLGDADLVSALVSQANSIYPVHSDAEMSAYLCAQAVLSPVTRLVADAAEWLATRTDDPEQAETFLRQLVSSSLANQRADGLLDALNTPGGYNQRLRLKLEDSGMRQALDDGLTDLEDT